MPATKYSRLLRDEIACIAEERERLYDSGDRKSELLAPSFLKRAVYELVYSRLRMPGRKGLRDAEGARQLIEALDELYGEQTRTKFPSGNVFHRVLKAVVPDDKWLSRSERKRLTCELEYARRHDIDPRLVVGFILQVGAGKEIEKLVKDDRREIGWS